MPRLVVEIHVPLVPAPDVAPEDYPYPWIDAIEEHIAQLQQAGDVDGEDDGEELSGQYLFFLSGRPEEQLLASAATVVARPGVPAGTYAVVTDSDADMGTGRRVELPARR